MRKSFIVIIICSLVSFISFSEIRRSSNAAFSIVNTQKNIVQPSAANYIRDGLVALWDGIENVGYGMHNENSTVWIDLAGNGYDGIFSFNQLGIGYSWTNNALIRYNNGLNGMWTPIDISEKILDSAQNATMTIQIVTSHPTGSDSWNSQIFNICRTPNEAFGTGIAGLVRNEVRGGVHTFAGITYATTESFIIQPYDAFCSATLVLDGSSIALYNGTKLAGNKKPAISLDKTIDKVYARLGSKNYAFRGYYHCYRIYNRALTEQEIDHNFEIDKVRFGL